MLGKSGFDTIVIHENSFPDKESGQIAPRITPAVAYAFPSAEYAAAVVAGKNQGIHYGRYGNPTIRTIEGKIAALEAGEDCVAVASGMAAISASLLCYLQSGDHVIVTKDVYGGAYSFLTGLAPRCGIEVEFVDCTDTDLIVDAIKSNTKAVYIETPSNPLLTVLDIEKIAKICKSHHLSLIVDNTFMSPYLQNPLKLGADLVLHSGTKYINGHGDVLAGFIIGKKDVIHFIRTKIMGDLGQNLNAWEAFLILRGIKTMGLRVRKHCESAQKIAEYLEENPYIEKVNYPGLKSHPQYELAQRQMRGMGGIVSFDVKGGIDMGKKFINSLKMAYIAFSLGDPETLVEHPASMTHASIPKEERIKFGITDGLIRLSVGLEDADDIIRDIDQALNTAFAGVEEFQRI